MPVAYHGKNPVGFVFLCRDKLQSLPIGLRKIFIDFFCWQADEQDCKNCLSIFDRFASFKNVPKCSSQSPQTFPVKKFFLQPPRKHEDRSAFKYVSLSFDNRSQNLRQLFGLEKQKMAKYIITQKSNSSFGTIAKAMGVKMTAKVVGKTQAFALA